MSAPCTPFLAARRNARPATTVLPLPTSPWRSRAIARPEERSAAISRSARFWAPVSRNGSALLAASRRAVSARRTIPERSRSRARFRSIAAASTRSSSRASRSREASRLSVARREMRALQSAQQLLRRRARRCRFRREVVQRCPDKRPPRSGRDAGDTVVDPDDSAGVERIGLFSGLEELGLRVFQPQLAARRHDRRSEEHERLARLRFLAEGGIPVVPDHADGSGAVVSDGLEAQASSPHPGGPDAAQVDQKRGRLPCRERGHRAVAAPVFIAEGKREQEVSDGSNALLREPGRARGSQAGDARGGIAKRKRRRPRTGCPPRRIFYAEGFQNVRATRPSLSTSP